MPKYAKKESKPAAKTRKTTSNTMRSSKTKTSKVSAPVAKQLTMTKSQMSMTKYAEVERLSTALTPLAGLATGVFKQYDGVAGAINPGIASMFPWLSGHANLYEMYRFKKLVFRFKTVAPTTAAGQVMLGFDSDPADIAPADAAQLSQLAKYADGPVWQKLSISCPCDQTWRYVAQSANVDTGRDSRLVHMGNFFAAVGDTANTNSIGYLEAEYVVEFKGKNPSGLAISPSRNVVQFIHGFGTSANTDIGLADIPGNIFGTPDTTFGGIVLRPGRYLISAQCINGTTFAGGSTFSVRSGPVNAATTTLLLTGGVAAPNSSTYPIVAQITLTAITKVAIRSNATLPNSSGNVAMTIELL